ncbi:cold-shock protein [Streptomyces sp. NPDC051563]|uniref:cold-shock protein n=1 Tax=Streptomyces sp. NPDC051563 TaxID=3365659 RepID=UPI0037875500
MSEAGTPEERITGFVRWWDREQGRGEIIPLNSEVPVPVVRADLRSQSGSLSEGQQVTFTLELGPVRFEARDVRP